MRRICTLLLVPALLFGLGLGFAILASAQQPRGYSQNPQNNQNHFYDGADRGVRGGNYGYDRRGGRYDRNDQGGIGPGKGALIGGAAGAVLGAAFGGGAKGALITGAAGAGIGAVLGQAAQDNRNNNNYYRR